MASSVTIRNYILVIAFVCNIVIGCTFANDDDYEPEIGPLGKHPDHDDSGEKGTGLDHEGDMGQDHGIDDKEPGPDHEGDTGQDHGIDDKEPGPDHEGDEGPGHGIDGDLGSDDGEGDKGTEAGAEDDNDPAHIAAGALLCFNEKHQIYSNCEESCRLTEHGELHVPHDHVDEFCSGPCFEETNLMLHCLDGLMHPFVFYNKATTQDIRDTILAGCGHGDKRGDFDVAEHIEADGDGESSGSKIAVPAVFGIVITIFAHILLL